MRQFIKDVWKECKFYLSVGIISSIISGVIIGILLYTELYK